MPAPSTASNTPKNARKPAIAGMKGFSVSNIVSILLDFDVHDPANHQEPAEDHDAATAQQGPAAPRGLLEDAQHIRWVEDAEGYGEHNGHQPDNLTGIRLLRHYHPNPS